MHFKICLASGYAPLLWLMLFICPCSFLDHGCQWYIYFIGLFKEPAFYFIDKLLSTFCLINFFIPLYYFLLADFFEFIFHFIWIKSLLHLFSCFLLYLRLCISFWVFLWLHPDAFSLFSFKSFIFISIVYCQFLLLLHYGQLTWSACKKSF